MGYSIYLSRADCTNCLRFFMMCYHEGVCDAFQLEDNASCQRFLDDNSNTIDIGNLQLSSQTENEYVFYLMSVCRKYKMYLFGMNFIQEHYKKVSIRPFLYLCVRFYMDGIKDFLDYPNPLRMDGFEPVYNAYWKPKDKHRNMMHLDVLDEVQSKSFDIIKILRDADGMYDKIITEHSVTQFSKALWSLSQPENFKYNNKALYRMCINQSDREDIDSTLSEDSDGILYNDDLRLFREEQLLKRYKKAVARRYRKKKKE